MINILNFIKDFGKKDVNDVEYNFKDVISFLSKTNTGQIPLIMHDWDNVWMYSLMVPIANLDNKNLKRLLDWRISPSHYHFNKTQKGIELSSLIDEADPEDILKGSIPPFIERNLDIENYTDFDINQMVSHSLNLYKSQDNRILTCKDNVPVGEIFHEDCAVCTLSRYELEKYLSLSNSVLIRFFDFKLYDNPNLSNNKPVEYFQQDSTYIFTLSNIENDGRTSLRKMRGFQIIFPENEYEGEV